MWDLKKSTRNNVQQVDDKMLKIVMKAHTHRSRNADIQLIPVVVGVVKDCNAGWVMGLC
jgi:hypothetical protein